MTNEVPKATIALIKEKIGVSISEFLDNALQLDESSMDIELKAEAIGAFC